MLIDATSGQHVHRYGNIINTFKGTCFIPLIKRGEYIIDTLLKEQQSAKNIATSNANNIMHSRGFGVQIATNTYGILDDAGNTISEFTMADALITEGEVIYCQFLNLPISYYLNKLYTQDNKFIFTPVGTKPILSPGGLLNMYADGTHAIPESTFNEISGTNPGDVYTLTITSTAENTFAFSLSDELVWDNTQQYMINVKFDVDLAHWDGLPLSFQTVTCSHSSGSIFLDLSGLGQVTPRIPLTKFYLSSDGTTNVINTTVPTEGFAPKEFIDVEIFKGFSPVPTKAYTEFIS